jgi:hypothetical protein
MTQVPPGPTISLDKHASVDEVRDCIIGVKNTAAGTDEVSVATLIIAWPAISYLVVDLFNACIDSGHHPLPVVPLTCVLTCYVLGTPVHFGEPPEVSENTCAGKLDR